MRSILLTFTILYIYMVQAADPCNKHKTCSDCIMDPNVCAWCAMENYPGAKCLKTSEHGNITSLCSTFLQNPLSLNTTETTNDKEFSSNLDNVVQIKPQKINFKLRIGERKKFSFSFKAADDYPVDLYFLLDASKTMNEVKEVIAAQSQDIYNTIKNLTNDVHLGVGTFVDKNALPYAKTINSNQTYSFRNQLKLTNDSEKFGETVKSIKFGENYDQPEGGFDGLAQVLACSDQIGWRNQSRKIIIFLTDELYHAAGDGIVAGIFQPYDGKCYTNDEGIYTKELEMDYPSPSMINKLAVKIGATVVFAVKNEKQNIYEQLKKVIGSSRSISFNGNEVVNTLKDIYEKITTTIKLKTNVKSDQKHNIEINFDPDCTGNNVSHCEVNKTEEKQFKASIKLHGYNRENKIEVEIFIEGTNERLKLEIEAITKCTCEGEGKENSPACHSGGTLECGICRCNADRYGEICACTKNKLNKANDNSTCIAEGDSRICSDQGSCICGTCHCNSVGGKVKYDGAYCQCDKDSCLRHNNTVCSGNGVCECGVCKCHTDWAGKACECSKSSSKCKKNDKICNNRGECICGKCNCRLSEGDARVKHDKFCVMLPCTDCHESQCKKLEKCASCKYQNNVSCVACEPFKSNTVDKLNLVELPSWHVCPDVRVDVGCYVRYVYRYDDDDVVELLIQTEVDCLESYYLFGGTFLATLIILGIATLVVWKLLTDARDRRENYKFMQSNRERNASIRVNPHYTEPTTEVLNPAYCENVDNENVNNEKN